jgi:xanthine dehydrogenase molybdopterin-binding subunit B
MSDVAGPGAGVSIPYAPSMAEQQEIQRGNVVLIPKGTPVTFSEDPFEASDAGRRRPMRFTRRDHVTLIDHAAATDTDHGEPTVGYAQGQEWRWVPARCARVLDTDNHSLRVHPRQVRGGGWGGWAASYMTSGSCACGHEFRKLESAVAVRQAHKEHLQRLAQAATAHDEG